MATDSYELRNHISGLSESPEMTKEEAGEISIVYESDKCTAIWIEYTAVTEGDEVKRKIPVMPIAKNATSMRKLPSGAKFKLIASVGRGGFLRADVIY